MTNLGDKLREKTSAAQGAHAQENAAESQQEALLVAKRIKDALPAKLERAASDRKSSYEVYELGCYDFDRSRLKDQEALLREAKLRGINSDLFAGVARLVYDDLVELTGVEIGLIGKPQSEAGRSWTIAVLVVKW